MGYRKIYKSSQLLTCDTFLTNKPPRKGEPKKRQVKRNSIALLPMSNSPDGPVLQLKIPYVDIAEFVFSSDVPFTVESHRHLSKLFYERDRIYHGIIITPATLFGNDGDHMSIMRLLLHQPTCHNMITSFNDINGTEHSLSLIHI